eukprot:TRINITY_DN2800_c1_g1_i1.p1 TRINITY_DN2800_c1_g1~~TRINITY_DN2800_c1_g1_i1.p1  ORF type:complete len:587 (+),score=210.99 TRINITY_DN2800_c1_g1_i1:77-1837(+)
MWGLLSLAVLASSLDDANPAPVGRRDGHAQLQAYEGKRTTCYLDAVAALKEGCDGTDGPMGEQARKKLALEFANCQFDEDGLPVHKTVETMAALAQDGETLAYSVYTYHMVNVELICISLSQQLLQVESRAAAKALAQATQESTAQLQKAQRTIRGVENTAVLVKASLEEHRDDMADGLRTVGARQVLLQRSIDEAAAVMQERVDDLNARIAHGQQRLEGLAAQSESISRNLMKVEVSAQQLHYSQTSMAMVVDNVKFVVTQLLGSVDSLKSLMYFSAAIVFVVLATTPQPTRSARLGMFATFAANLAAEQYIAEVEDFQLAALPYPMTKDAVYSYCRWVFACAAAGHLLKTWWSYRDPQQQLCEDVAQLQIALATLLERIPQGVRRLASASVGRADGTPPPELPSRCGSEARRGGSVEPVRPQEQQLAAPRPLPLAPQEVIPVAPPVAVDSPSVKAATPSAASAPEAANASPTTTPTTPVLRYSSAWAPPAMSDWFGGGWGGFGAWGWAAPAQPTGPVRKACIPVSRDGSASSSSSTCTSSSSSSSSSSSPSPSRESSCSCSIISEPPPRRSYSPAMWSPPRHSD